MTIAATLGTARGLLDEAQKYALLRESGKTTIVITGKDGAADREIDTAREAKRLGYQAKAAIEDAISRLQIEGGRR